MSYQSKIADRILLNPFDKKASIMDDRKILTKEEFMEKCYVQPEFLEVSSSYKQFEEEKQDVDGEETKESLEKMRSKQEKDYQHFLNWLKFEDGSTIYMISGNAGSGKSTFVNYLNYSKKEYRWVILDLSFSAGLIQWLPGVSLTISNFSFGHKKIFSSMLEYMRELLFGFSAENLSEDYIQKMGVRIDILIKNYSSLKNKNYFFNNDFYDNLIQEYQKMIDFSSGEKIIRVARYFNEKFCIYDKENFNSIYSTIYDIFVIFLRCFYGLNEKFIIVIDNIERFIATDEIFLNEIKEIGTKINDYCSVLNKNENSNRKYFKFILVVRNSTKRMMDVRQQEADSLPNDVMLSEWFDIEKIIDKKEKWYLQNDFIDEEFSLLKQITGDIQVCLDGKITGLKLYLDMLFNYNKRLTIDFIGIIIETNQKYIEKYKELWGINTPLSRFAARSVIKGLILSELEKEDKLFRHLKTYSSRGRLGLGDARKILSILLNHFVTGEGATLELTHIFRIITQTDRIFNYFNSANLRQKKFFAELFYYMNSSNRRMNDWIQLIDIQKLIKSTEEKEKETITINELMDIFNIKDEEKFYNAINGYHINIMPAGIAYMKYIVSSFEFFAMRYCEDYEPLFTLLPSKSDLEGNIEDLKCIKIISTVQKQAVACIKHIKNTEQEEFKITFGKEMNKKYHFERIKEHHKAYLDNFIKFIEEQYDTSEYKVQMLINKVDDIKRRYY